MPPHTMLHTQVCLDGCVYFLFLYRRARKNIYIVQSTYLVHVDIVYFNSINTCILPCICRPVRVCTHIFRLPSVTAHVYICVLVLLYLVCAT